MARAGSSGRENRVNQAAIFRILGPLTIEANGEPQAIGGARQHRFLAMLLLHRNAVVPFDRIVDVLWDIAPRSARQQMHNSMGSLRRTIRSIAADVELVTTDFGYRLRASLESVDVSSFQQLLKASDAAEIRGDIDQAVRSLAASLELWRGPALAGLDGQYFRSVAAQLDEQRLDAIERFMDLRLRRGEASSLVSDLVGLVADNPFREALRGTLMLALYRSGRQGDALAAYDEGRRLLAKELGLDPGGRIQELHDRILSSEDVGPTTASRIEPPANRTLRARSATGDGSKKFSERFLPHDTTDFTGRSAEIDELLRSVHHDSSTALIISALDGMGGVGKTTLAIHVSHRLSNAYPDGQYFIDLHGFSVGAEPVSSEQALDDLLMATGVPIELVPADLDTRSALWRSRLAGKRALVLLDNAKDEAQVRPLLPGSAGNVVLVTSRRRLTALEGATPLSLDVLPHKDAIKLFVQIAGAQRASATSSEVAEAVELCGRLPLAIRVAAARFRDRKSWSISDLLQQLRTHRRRTRFLAVGDRSVMAVLRLSYHYLSPMQRLVFRMLALHPGLDFHTTAAAALSGCSLEETEQCLDALFECNLLVQRQAGYYEFHDLVRDCARELLDEHDSADTRREATQRILDYYLDIAQRFQLRTIPPFLFDPVDVGSSNADRAPLSTADSMSILDANYHGLLGAIRLAAQEGWHTHAWRIPCILMPYLSRRNYGREAVDLFKGALEAARSLKDRHGEMASLAALGIISRDRGSGRSAQDFLQQAIKLGVDSGNLSWQAYVSNELGIAQLNDGLVRLAHKSFSNAAALAHNLHDQWLSAAAANNLGVVCREMGQLIRAMTYFDQAAARNHESISDRSKIARMVNNGRVYHLQGRLYDAMTILEQALELSRQVGYEPGEASVLCSLADVQRSSGYLELAVEHGRNSLVIARRLGLAEIECSVLNALGEALVSLKDLTDAEVVFRQAEERAMARGLTLQVGRASEGFAHISLARGELAVACARWEKVLSLYPDGVAAAGYARDHLRSIGEEANSCARCVVYADGRPERLPQ